MDLKLSNRVAEEAQLLSEERWIIDALRKIKNHRNCLQIERLHLESLKAQANAKLRATKDSIKTPVPETQPSVSRITAPSPLTLMKQYPSHRIECEVPQKANVFEVEDFANTEELNLTVTNSLFGQFTGYNTEEEEEDEDENEQPLDIDLLMATAERRGPEEGNNTMEVEEAYDTE